MKFKVNDISACDGGDHIYITVQRLPAGRVWTRMISKKAALNRLAAEETDLEERVADRLIAAARESGETTGVGIRNALLNQEFDI